jgi:hypothetical protein
MDWHDHYEAALRSLHNAGDHFEDDPLASLRWLGKTNDHFAEVAIVMCQRALDAGATKKAMAEALRVTPSTFRGMVKTR